MRRKSIIKKYEGKYKGDQSDNMVLHLELKELERRYKKEKRYDKQTKDLFEEINKVLCFDLPNLELLLYDMVCHFGKNKSKTPEQIVTWYSNLRNTESRLAEYLGRFVNESR